MTSYYPQVEPTQKWSDMSQQEQRSAKDRFGSRSAYQERKQAATSLPGVMPPRENPGFAPPSFGGGGNQPIFPPSFGGGGDKPTFGGGRAMPKGPKNGPTPYTGPAPDSGGVFGGRIGQKPGTAGTADFKDSDGDGVDDRNQRKAGGRNVVKRQQERQQKRDARETKGSSRQAAKAENFKENYKGKVKKAMRKKKNRR